MKLFDILLGKKKKTQNIDQKSSTAPTRHPAARTASSAVQVKSLPKKQPDTGRSALRSQDFYASEPVIFQGQRCGDDNHDFVRPYPLTCRKCGLTLQWDSDSIGKYMGSYFENVSYQWTRFMDKNDIVSFRVSAGDRPVFEASCDFTHLRIRNCLNGSRDGWMQSQYPSDYFEPRDLPLRKEDIQQLQTLFKNINFSAWATPVHYVENHDAPGFFVNKCFRCTFADGKQFVCLDPDNTEFQRFVSIIREMVRNNGKKEDQAFIQRMLKDSEKKEKQIFWLISCSESMEGKWMNLLKQGVPFFNYGVARDMKNGQNANAELLVNVIRFSNGAAWVTDAPVPEEEYQWETLPIGKRNDTGAAFSLLAERFETLPEPERKLFPIVILVLDGIPTDDYLSALKYFKSLPGVERNVLTVVFAMGDHVDKKLLKTFRKSCVFHINSLDDFLYEIDTLLFSF